MLSLIAICLSCPWGIFKKHSMFSYLFKTNPKQIAIIYYLSAWCVNILCKVAVSSIINYLTFSLSQINYFTVPWILFIKCRIFWTLTTNSHYSQTLFHALCPFLPPQNNGADCGCIPAMMRIYLNKSKIYPESYFGISFSSYRLSCHVTVSS